MTPFKYDVLSHTIFHILSYNKHHGGIVSHIFHGRSCSILWNVRNFVVDADSQFKLTFKAICKILHIMYWHLLRGNHEGNSVGNITVFLTKHKPSQFMIGVVMHFSFIIPKHHNTHGIAHLLITRLLCVVSQGWGENYDSFSPRDYCNHQH